MPCVECIRALESGRVVAFATDTFYALACDPYNLKALNQLRALKGRSASRPLPLLIAQDYDWQELGCEHTGLTRTLARLFWPGKLTMIVPCHSDLAARVGREGDDLLGLRVPGGDWLQELLSQWGGPVVGTSANLSGQPPARSCDEAREYFGNKVFYVDGGMAPGGAPSTVVQLVKGGLRVIREGAVTIEAFSEWRVR